MKRVFLYVVTNLAIVAVMAVMLAIITVVLAHYGIEWRVPVLNRRQAWIAILVAAALLGLGGSLVSLSLSKWIAKRATGARIIYDPRSSAEQWLRNTLRRLARQARIPAPELGVYESPSPNAFSIGGSRKTALVAVSNGLLEHLTQDQIEAVLGHEISHAANGDMATLALIQGALNTYVYAPARLVSLIVDGTIFRFIKGSGPGYWITLVIMQILFGWLASLIVLWFSRRREFRADAGGVYLAGRDKTTGALQALQRASGKPFPAGQLRRFGIAGYPGATRLMFSAHPWLEKRLAVLRKNHKGAKAAATHTR